MPYLLNILYLTGLAILSPWLLFRSLKTGKFRRGLAAKWTGQAVQRDADEPCAWFHGVSVGEIHMLTRLVAEFQDHHPGWDCVISTTTETGYAEASRRFPQLPVFYWPFDFTWAVQRALRRVNPTIVLLAEGELWPNFLTMAHRRGVPVTVVNGRMSPNSERTWSRLLGVAHPEVPPTLANRLLATLVRPWVADIFHHVSLWAMQTKEYAAAVCSLGVPAQHVQVTGNIKYDGVEMDRDNKATTWMRRLLAIEATEPVLVVGSTQAPEESILLGIWQRLRVRLASLRLILVPRQKERFETVAKDLEHAGVPFKRLSALKTGTNIQRREVILGDTFGDLSALWGLATVAYVGGSLDGKRGGQNMIEPAAFGTAVVFGPHVWNFRDTVERLLAAQAAVQIADAAELENVLERLFANASERERLGAAARAFVLSQQGATGRTLEGIVHLLHEDSWGRAAA